jgi:chromosome segregation ATPase
VIDETDNCSLGPEDFGGSDYMAPEEEKRYVEQQRKRREEQPVVTKPKHIELLERCFSLTNLAYYESLATDIRNYLDKPDELSQAIKNGVTRAEFLQQLVDSSEAANIERQGKIEALEKEQEALLATVAQLRSENKKLTARVNNLEYQKSCSRDVVDYRRADPDLLADFALAVLDNGVDYDGLTGEARELQEQIEKSSTFHPHVQQEVTKDSQGILRFRKNELVNRLVEEAGADTRLKGLNYIATLEACVEDRAQLAQLIGYSVDGYQSLSYSLPVEEDKIPTK